MNLNLGDLTKWIQLKPQQLLAISLVSGLVIFLPNTLLDQIGVGSLKDRLQPWVGIVFLISSALLISQALFKGFNWVRRQQKMRVQKSEALKTLRTLTPREKKTLAHYMDGDTKTQILSAGGVTGGLCGKGILYQSSNFGKLGWGDAPDFPFNMADWAWDYLKKHPELIETSDTDS